MNRLETTLFAAGLLALSPTLGCQGLGETWSNMSTGEKTTLAGVGGAVVGGATAAVFGADTEDALLVGLGAGLLTAGATYLYDSHDASEEEQRHASRKAADAKVQLQEEQIHELKQQNAVLAVRVDDLEDHSDAPASATTSNAPADSMEVVFVDLETGEPVDDEVHTIREMPAGSQGKIEDQAVVFLG